MKLFKKLAAAVLVAALALMMVGCSGSNIVLTRQIKNAVSDVAAYYWHERATDSRDLDALAAKLLTEYDKAIAASEEGEWPDLQELLDDEKFLQKAGIDPEKNACWVTYTPVPSYLSDTLNTEKPFELAQKLLFGEEYVIGAPEVGSKYEFGLAIGTLDGEDYVLMLVK